MDNVKFFHNDCNPPPISVDYQNIVLFLGRVCSNEYLSSSQAILDTSTGTVPCYTHVQIHSYF